MNEREDRPEGDSRWASLADELTVDELPEGAINLNVEGRQLTGMLTGFGQMWQKTYHVRLSGVDAAPEEVVEVWKDRFPEFWPEGNEFFGPLTGIKPGEVGVLNLSAPGGLKLSTGILVIFADADSFSFMTPEGHMFAGMITFSAHEEEGTTVAQVQTLMRANDPVYEIGFRLGVISKIEDDFWEGTLARLASHFELASPQITQSNRLVDPRVQWREASNIWKNAGIRTALYMPVILARRLLDRLFST